jgi:ligand-binding SRPBCC domain-containing protein
MNVSTPPDPISFTEQDDGSTLLQASQWIPHPLEEVFRFFSQPENLQTLTPSHVKFQLLEETPVTMEEGRELSYRLRVKGIPIGWTSKITLWDPPNAFADIQIKGPYHMWDHTHTFEREGSGTRVIDKVIYKSPGFRWMERALVRPDIRKIFAFRHKTLESVFQGAVPNLA